MRVIPTSVLIGRVPTLLAADDSSLAPMAGGCKVHLIASAFTPGRALTFAGLTEATFTGGAAKVAAFGAQQNFRDPVTGILIVEMVEPLGGWTWICTATPGTPETIFGWVLTDNASLFTYGAALFDTPVVIAAAGDAVVVDNVQVQFPIGFMG